jgi:ResB-like family
VWAGVVFRGIGLTFVFYVAHTRFWVVPVRETNGQLTLWFGGTANRNRDAFEQLFEDLTVKIEAQLKSMSEAPASSQVVSIA